MLKTYFDERETRTPATREAGLMAALPRILHHAKSQSLAYGRLLADVEPQTVTTREALAKLPLTRKSDLIDAQAKEPPLAGLNATPVPAMARLFQSPGRFMIRKEKAMTGGAWAGRSLRLASARAISCITACPIT